MKARLLVICFIMSTGLTVIAGDSVPEVITTVAGNGTAGFSGDGGPALLAQINVSFGMAFDSAGNLYFSDSDRIRRVTRDGYISTVAGNGIAGHSGDGGPATQARLRSPAGISLDATGNLYITEFYYEGGYVRKVTTDGVIQTIAHIDGASRVALDKEGNLYIAQTRVVYPGFVYKIATDGSQSIVAGAAGAPPPQEGDNATSISLGGDGSAIWCTGIAIDPDGDLLFATHERIFRVMPDGRIHIVAGGGDQAPGEGGPATAAKISPRGLAVDAQGNVFTADGARIRKVTIDGRISTVAGNGTVGYSGDGGPALSAALNDPRNVALDASGNLYIADSGNQRIRKVDGVGVVGSTSYFPQVAVGDGWSTLFTFTNTGSAEASGLLTLKDSQGNPLLVRGQWGNSAGTEDPASSFRFSVPSGGSISLLATVADIADTRRTGWAQLETAGSPVSGMVSYEHAVDSITDSIVSIPCSQPIQLAVIPVDADSSSGKQPAYCIVNPGSQSISINLSLIADDGTVRGNSIRMTLGPGEQVARYPFLQDVALDQFKGSLVIRAESGRKFLTIGLFEKQGLFASIPLAKIE